MLQKQENWQKNFSKLIVIHQIHQTFLPSKFFTIRYIISTQMDFGHMQIFNTIFHINPSTVNDEKLSSFTVLVILKNITYLKNVY